MGLKEWTCATQVSRLLPTIYQQASDPQTERWEHRYSL